MDTHTSTQTMKLWSYKHSRPTNRIPPLLLFQIHKPRIKGAFIGGRGGAGKFGGIKKFQIPKIAQKGDRRSYKPQRGGGVKKVWIFTGFQNWTPMYDREVA